MFPIWQTSQTRRINHKTKTRWGFICVRFICCYKFSEGYLSHPQNDKETSAQNMQNNGGNFLQKRVGLLSAEWGTRTTGCANYDVVLGEGKLFFAPAECWVFQETNVGENTDINNRAVFCNFRRTSLIFSWPFYGFFVFFVASQKASWNEMF